MDVKRIRGTAAVGDILVLDHVSLGTDDPLHRYTGRAAFFTVTEVRQVQEHTPPGDVGTTYTLRDTAGVEIQTAVEPFGGGVNYLIAVEDWREWKNQQEEKKRKALEERIRTLSDREAVLREVLTAQGVRVVTEPQAVALGIKRPG